MVQLTPMPHVPLLQVLARTGSHFENFNRFFQTKLPPGEFVELVARRAIVMGLTNVCCCVMGAGFPVKFNIPVVPTVSAKFEFTSASFQDGTTCVCVLFTPRVLTPTNGRVPFYRAACVTVCRA